LTIWIQLSWRWETVKSMENHQLQIALNKVREDIVIEVKDAVWCLQSLLLKLNQSIQRCPLQNLIINLNLMESGELKLFMKTWNS
jgi:formyltetrahydrofolate hydrolase